MDTKPFPTTAVELRRQLSSRDGKIQHFSDNDWRMIEADGTVAGYLDDPGWAQYEEVVLQVRRYQRGEPGRRQGSKTGGDLKNAVPPAEKKRAEVFSRALARRATRRPELQEIRTRLLGQGLLTIPEVNQLLMQVGPRHLGFDWFKNRRIPIVGHQSYYVDPKTKARTDLCKRRTRIAFEWKDRRTVVTPSRIDPDWSRSDTHFEFADRFTLVRKNAVFGELQQAAAKLANHYYWNEGDAAIFILTGVAPPVPAIGITGPLSLEGIRDDHLHFRIELVIEPWVSAATVKKAYGALQRRIYGRQARPIDEGSLAIFDFVEEYLLRELGLLWTDTPVAGGQTGDMSELPWSAMAKLWDKTHGVMGPGMSGRELSRNFRRNCNQIIRRVDVGVKVRDSRRKGAQGRDAQEKT
jgi:hypothetical protein